MFIVENNKVKVLVPGYLSSYQGELMMVEYGRYMAMLPYLILANTVVLLLSTYALMFGGNSSALMAFSAYMIVFSIRMGSSKLVRVRISGGNAISKKAPLIANVNSAISGAALALIGFKYQRLTGELDGMIFKVAGVIMIALAALCVAALRGARTES